MKRSEARVGGRVFDRWWPEWGVGRLVQLKKTRWVVQFPDRVLTYDNAHAQFLAKAKRP